MDGGGSVITRCILFGQVVVLLTLAQRYPTWRADLSFGALDACIDGYLHVPGKRLARELLSDTGGLL